MYQNNQSKTLIPPRLRPGQQPGQTFFFSGTKIGRRGSRTPPIPGARLIRGRAGEWPAAADGMTRREKRKRDESAADGPERPGDGAPTFVRQFPHVDGQWACHVLIPVAPSPETRVLLPGALRRGERRVCASAARGAQGGSGAEAEDGEGPALVAIGRPHISLSRTFCLRYHQLEPFHDVLRGAIEASGIGAFDLQLGPRCRFLENDTGTRTFLSIVADGPGSDRALQLIRAVDVVLERFQQEPYYADAVVHSSIASLPSAALEGRTLPPGFRLNDEEGPPLPPPGASPGASPRRPFFDGPAEAAAAGRAGDSSGEDEELSFCDLDGYAMTRCDAIVFAFGDRQRRIDLHRE